MKKIIALFSLPLFLLSCDPEPISDYSAFVESVSGQTYTTMWDESRKAIVEIHDITDEEVLPFSFQVGDKHTQGHISLNTLTRKGQTIHAPLVQEINWFPFRPQTLKSFHFRLTGDADYTLESAIFEEISPLWPKPYSRVLDFSPQESDSDLGLPNLDRIP